MFEVGKVQKAYINRLSEYGAFLSDEVNGEQEILLPKKFLEKGLDINDELEVFIYHDSEQRLTATTQKPIIQVGEIGLLKCVGKIKAGYFLNNGIDKDVFLPYNEAKSQLTQGTKYLVMMYLDTSGQLVTTMKIYNHLETNAGYTVNQHVVGTVYDVKDMGAFVAVDNKYHGFIPSHEVYREIKAGAKIEARITKIRDDGKLNLSIKQKAAVQIHSDVDVLTEHLNKSGGYLPLNDESDPEEIKRVLNMSKRAFKRAVGVMLKEGKLQILEDGVKLMK